MAEKKLCLHCHTGTSQRSSDDAGRFETIINFSGIRPLFFKSDQFSPKPGPSMCLSFGARACRERIGICNSTVRSVGGPIFDLPVSADILVLDRIHVQSSRYVDVLWPSSSIISNKQIHSDSAPLQAEVRAVQVITVINGAYSCPYHACHRITLAGSGPSKF